MTMHRDAMRRSVRQRMFDELIGRRAADVDEFYSAMEHDAACNFEYKLDSKRTVSRQRYVPARNSDLLHHQVFRDPMGMHPATLVYGLVGGTSRAFHAHLTVDRTYVERGSVHVTVLYPSSSERDSERGSKSRSKSRSFAYDRVCSTSFRLDERDAAPFADGRRDRCEDALKTESAAARNAVLRLVNAFSAYAARVASEVADAEQAQATVSTSRAMTPPALIPPALRAFHIAASARHASRR